MFGAAVGWGTELRGRGMGAACRSVGMVKQAILATALVCAGASLATASDSPERAPAAARVEVHLPDAALVLASADRRLAIDFSALARPLDQASAHRSPASSNTIAAKTALAVATEQQPPPAKNPPTTDGTARATEDDAAPRGDRAAPSADGEAAPEDADGAALPAGGNAAPHDDGAAPAAGEGAASEVDGGAPAAGEGAAATDGDGAATDTDSAATAGDDGAASDVDGAAPDADDAAAMPSTTLPARPDAHEIVDTNAPRLLTEQEPTLKKQWEQQHGGFAGSRLAIQRRLTGFPSRLLVDRTTLPRQSRAFLKRLAEDTWNGLMALTDFESGFPVDHIRLDGAPMPPLSAHIGDYVNVTSIGLQLASIAAAWKLELIRKEDAQIEAGKILDTLGHLERHEGQFFNYYDTTSLEPTSNFVSFVDTAWLVAGLIVTRQAFPDLAGTVNQILDPIDLGFFYDRTTRHMSHGYYVAKGVLSVYTYGAFYTEARLGSLIAIGKGDAPVNHWYAMKRAFKPRCNGEDCPSTHELAYTARDGRTMRVTAFRWQGRQYVPSWGGSMFEALMPRLVLDERRYAPRSLGPNGEAHAMIQQEYARDVLGYPVWGMSPSTTPEDGRYGEYGVPVLGSHGYDPRIVTPHAAALALAVAPDDAANNLMELARRYPIYGEYGFYDAVDPRNGEVGYSLLQLDQAMLFLSVANHLTQGAVPRLFASDPYVKPALALLGEERFFE